MRPSILAFLLVAATHAFQLQLTRPAAPARVASHLRHGSAARCCVAAEADINFASPRWEKLRKHLDTLPVFTCVNAEGEPLGYERDGEPLAIYFADAARAQQELETMSSQFPALQLRLIGVGLGTVFRQHTEGSAARAEPGGA